MLQGIGGCSCAQPVHAQSGNRYPCSLGVVPYHRIDAIGADSGARCAAAQRMEEGSIAFLLIMAGGFQVDEMQWQKAQLAALAVNAQVLDASALLQVGDHQRRGFFTTKAVGQQHRQNGAIALALERVRIWRIEQGLGLVIIECRRFSFIGFDTGTFDPMYRVAATDGIAVEQVIIEAGQRRQFASNGCAGQAPAPEARQQAGHQLEVVQDGDDPAYWKPMKSVGQGVREIRIKCKDRAFRVYYVVNWPEAIYVLHVFRKTIEKTEKRDIDLAKARYKSLD